MDPLEDDDAVFLADILLDECKEAQRRQTEGASQTGLQRFVWVEEDEEGNPVPKRSRTGEGRQRRSATDLCTARHHMDVLAVPADRWRGWYLSLMVPNVKGPMFAWLDPSRLYCNPQALADCVKDLLRPFHDDPIDLVAGIDAMGFILGASAATVLGKGFLAVRKAGHLCVATESQSYSDYTGREKTMEVRVDVLKPGMRVLLVDQWIETGGTMKAAIQLVEKLGATVAGVAAVAIENSEGGKWIKDNYKSSHCIPEELQAQLERRNFDFFKRS